MFFKKTEKTHCIGIVTKWDPEKRWVYLNVITILKFQFFTTLKAFRVYTIEHSLPEDRNLK